MASKTDGERLERVEANLEMLTDLVKEQGKVLGEIKDSQITAAAVNASKEYVDTKIEAASSAINLKITEAKRKNTLLVWLTGTLSAVFGAVLALLVAFFVNTVASGAV